MARPRNFNEDEVVALAGKVFSRLGYNATSIDDLLEATGLQRGSLYKAFGSKRNLFEKVLVGSLMPGWAQRSASIDLLICALKEMASVDRPIAELCRTAVMEFGGDAAGLLGQRLLAHLD